MKHKKGNEMRAKLVTLIIALTGITGWALFHQISKKEITPETITLYAYYTSNTKTALEAALPASSVNEYTLVLKEQNEMSMHYKIDLMLHAIQENWGGIFVLRDIESQGPPPPKEVVLKTLEHADIVVQKASSPDTIGSGYIACRANKRTLQLWESIKYLVDEHPTTPDQEYLNTLLHENKIAKLRWDYLPSKENPIA